MGSNGQGRGRSAGSPRSSRCSTWCRRCRRRLDAGFRPAPAGGGALVALGGVLRLGGQTFAWAMPGQAAVAVAQPLVLNAVGKLAAAAVSLPAIALAERFAPSTIRDDEEPTLGHAGSTAVIVRHPERRR